MRIPLPLWYLTYLDLHGQPPPPPDSATGPRRHPHEVIQVQLDEHNTPPEILIPRSPSTTSKAEQLGTAHAPWIRRPFPVCCQSQVVVANLGSILHEHGEEEEEEDAIPMEDYSLLLGCMRPLDENTKSPNKISSPSFFPDYSLLPSSQSITSFDGSGWLAPPRRDPPQPPPLPRPLPANLEADPMTPDEAEQLLRELLGDEFDTMTQRLPPKAEVPRPSDDQQRELRVGATWVYDVDPESGQVSHMELHWGWVAGPFADITHAYDIYLTECDLMERQTRDDD